MAKSSKKKPRAAATPDARDTTHHRPAQTTHRPSALDRARAFHWRDRRDLVPLGIVLAAAFVLRMVFFYFNQRNNPVFNYPIMDALYHSEWAEDILAGGTWAADDVYFRGPLYPYLLAFLYKISHSSIAFVVFVQHVMGTLSAGLLYLLAREYFSPRVAFVAGVVGALYWPLVYFEGDLLIETFFMLLNVVAFVLFAKAARRHRLRLYAAAGIALGLSAVARPSILIFFPAVPLFIWLTSRRPGAPDTTPVPGWLCRFAVTAVAVALVIAPVMVRNYRVGHAFVPVAASGGVNFYIGNNPQSDGSTAIVPGTRASWWGGYEDAIAIAERDEGKKLRLAEVSDYYFARGLDYWDAQPGAAARLTIKKLRVFWAGPERANNKFIYFFWHLAGMKYVPLPGFWLVAPLGLLGMVLLWPRRRELSMLYLFVALYSAGVVAFFVNARFRLPVVPVLILFAAYAAVWLVEHYRERNLRVFRAVVVLVVAAVIVNSDYLWVRQMRSYAEAISHNSLGNAYIKMGLKDTALDHFMLADQINRKDPTPAYQLIARDVDYNLGTLLWEKGLCSRAIDALSRVGGSDSIALTALDHLGDCLLKRNDVQQAASAYQRFLQIEPNDVRGVTGMARCHAATGNYDAALKMLEPVVDPTQSVYPPAYLALADIQRATGRIDAAIESYTQIARYTGYERDALMALAQLYIEKGDKDNAMHTLETAQNYFPPGDLTVQRLMQSLRSGQ
jgi:tetratricopeptide (TPR) repeat protein